MAAIEVVCPKCSAHYKVDAKHAGRIGRCKRCGTRFEMASTSATPECAASPESHAPNSEPPASKTAEDGVPEVWKPGDVILDLYEVKGVLGEGGFGTVYRVHHRGWNTDLAVKSPRAGGGSPGMTISARA